MTKEQNSPRKIGTLNEKPLHESLKQWYALPGDLFEVSMDRFVIDILRDDLLIEIQTRSFGKMKRKLQTLLALHPVRLVYPIPSLKWIVKEPVTGDAPASRRKSPKRGVFENIFDELISFPELLLNPNLSLELLLIEEEEVRRYDANRGWRRHGWITQERRLLRVTGRKIIHGPADLSAFLPSGLKEPFTTNDIAGALTKPRPLAQKMVYCLRSLGCIKQVGKSSNSILYAKKV